MGKGVLELKAPHDGTVRRLLALWPVFLSYVLSFLVVAIPALCFMPERGLETTT